MNLTDFNDFINSLVSEKIPIHYDSTENSKTIKSVFNQFRLEFYLSYESKVINYLPPTHSNPEEGDFEFTNIDHEEIALYKGSE